MKNALINGDSLDILKKFPDNSFDSMVTDPPAGIAFMGKKWDKDKGGRKLWIAWLESIMTEAFRTLKPGAHILVWAIPRTSHWTATAIENADFEIRDVVTHIFGSGFPKSQNISKAIDRQAGVKRQVVGIEDTRSTYDGKERKSKATGPLDFFRDSEKRKDCNDLSKKEITVPATPEAKQWDGWGTALKPASEHWILARKPLSEKTIAANVLEHGTGGINIDASRITTADNLNGGAYAENLHRAGRSSLPGDTRKGASAGMFQPGNTASCNFIQPKGRFPANLILSHKPDCKQVGTKEGKGYTINRFTDGAKPFGNGAGHPYEVEDQGPETIAVWECEDDCPVQALDNQSGTLKSGAMDSIAKGDQYNTYGKMYKRRVTNPASEGGASRFFYCAKASKSEKTLNKTIDNKHPTVKSLKLMKYLINLVTPPGGVVLDPFMGSGTTGQAALEGNFGFVGVELEEASFEISKARCSSITNVIINKKK